MQKLYPTSNTAGNGWDISHDGYSSQIYFFYASRPNEPWWAEELCPVTPALGEWQHVAFTYSASDNYFKAYLNGALVASQVPIQSPLPMDTTLPIHFMHDRYSNYGEEGLLDEVRLYNRAVSDKEAAELALRNTPPIPPPVPNVPVPCGRILYSAGFREFRMMDTKNHVSKSVTDPDRNIMGVTWSPDRQHVAFERWLYGGDAQICLVNADRLGDRLDETDIFRVTDGTGNYTDPAFSPDGTRLAFSRPYGSLCLINTNRDGFEDTGKFLQNPSWSPDGNEIVGDNWGATYNSDLFVYDLSTKTVTQLTHHQSGESFHCPAWGPDGTIICLHSKAVYGVQGAWHFKICVIDENGNPSDLTGDWDCEQYDPSWAPSGEYILFTAAQNGVYDIWAMWRDGTGRVNLTQNQDVESNPSIVPYPLVINCPADITDVADANCSAVIPDIRPNVNVGNNCGDVQIDQKPEPGTSVGPGIHPITVTAADEAGGAATCICSFIVIDKATPTLSCPENIILPADAEGGAVVPDVRMQVTAVDNCGGMALSQSPLPGTRVGYGPHPIRVTATDTSGNSMSCTTSLKIVDQTPPGPKPIGEFVYAVDNQELRILDTATGDSRLVLKATDNITTTWPVWSPDGEWIVFMAGGSSGIWKIRPDGTQAQPLASGAFHVPAVSPDGTKVAYEAWTYGPVEIVNWSGQHLAWMPGGCRGHTTWGKNDIIVSTDWGCTYQSDLYAYHYPSGQSWKLTAAKPNEAFDWGSFSPDGSRFTANWLTPETRHWKVITMSADGSDPKPLTTDWEDSHEWYATWSNDGQYLIFTSDHGGQSDIWAMRPNGSGRVKLTNDGPREGHPVYMRPADVLAPQLFCPESRTIEANSACQAEIPDFLSSLVISDNRTPVERLIKSQRPEPGTLVPIGEHSVRITVSDDSGNVAECATTFTVVDSTPPVIACPRGTITDADATCGAHIPDVLPGVTATDNCGTSHLTQEPPAGTEVGLGEHTITVTAKDAAGNTASGTTIFTVVDGTAPELSAIIAPIDPAVVNSTIAVSASYIENCGLKTAMWEWGDGGTSAGTVDPTQGKVTGSHLYTAAGVYTVTLTVTDHANNPASISFQYVVVYDPAAGFVTGGGWINSPVGAYTASPSLAGKATFGFVSKYQKGANVPTGQTQFNFHVAGMVFRSTAYQWLVVAGAKAQFKGSGTINGTGDLGFLLMARDGEAGGECDEFRIKIWSKSNGEVIYDNEMGSAENVDPTTCIQGGSIVVHTQK